MDFENETFIVIGKNIKKFRLANNLSQEKLSALLGANDKFIGHVERVERHISLKMLIKLSKILSVPMKEFFNYGELD